MIAAIHGILEQVRPGIASGALLDFNPATGVTYDGSNKVSAVNMGSGYTVTQATAAKQPTYNPTGFNGKPCISFDGVDDALAVAFSQALSEITIKVVARSSKNSGIQALFEKSLTFGARYSTSNYTTVLGSASTAWNSGATDTLGHALNTLQLTTSRYTSGLLNQAINANILTPPKTAITGALNSSAYSISIGAATSGSANFLQGDIARILFWDRYLTDQENSDTDKALKQEYGLTY